MSLELWTTIASVGTFVVITATAIAAVVQLYHIRSSNQIAILNEFRIATEAPEFREAMEFLRGLSSKLEDKAFRAQFDQNPLPQSLYPILRIGYLYETMGSYVKRGILDADLVCDLWAPVVTGTWDRMADAIVVSRRTRGESLYENFEYLAYISERFIARRPSYYPQGVPRIAPADHWAKEDGVQP